MFEPIAAALAFFYSLWDSYGMAIALLTLVIMVVLTPLTLKSTRSMIEMQRLQPELKKLQAEHKEDRQKLNEEMMAMYRERGVNPLGGCLPLLVQTPVFIVLYQVLRGLTARAGTGSHIGRVSMQNVLGETPTTDSLLRPKYLDESTELFQDLSESTDMVSWGIDLARSASTALSDSITTAIPYLIMIAIVAVSGYYQQRQISGRNPGAAVNPQQQMITRIMPIMLPVISFGLPAGVVVYWVISNCYRVLQQGYITRRFYADNPVPAVDAAATKADAAAGNKRTTPKSKAESKPKADGGPKSGSKKTAKTTGPGRSTKGNDAAASAAPKRKTGPGRVTAPGTQATKSAPKKKRK